MKIIYPLVLLVCMGTNLFAQQFDSPVAYMDAILADERKITEDYLGYNSSIAHGKSARKVEKNRAELVASVKSAIRNAEKMSGYNGDESLKKAVLEYLDLSYKVLNDDYAKIVDMEEIAEQSYDNMEAYMLAMSEVDKKMDHATEVLDVTYEAFAAANNVTIVKTEDKLSIKMKKTAEVNAYYNKAYLIFFKSYKQYLYLMTALEEKKAGNIEQNRSQLEKDTQKGIEDMNALGSFNGDPTLPAAARKLFDFYKKLSAELIPPMVDYNLKNERFAEQKKNFDAKGSKTKQDVDEFNAAVNDLNAAVNASNKASQEMNTLSQKNINEWNNATANFMSKHVPRSK